jgi:hypothetical protein
MYSVEGTVNIMEHKTQVFGQNDVEEFHLRIAFGGAVQAHRGPLGRKGVAQQRLTLYVPPHRTNFSSNDSVGVKGQSHEFSNF